VVPPTLFTPFLIHQGVIILDGALATELEARGADLNDPLWSAKLLLESPALIRQLHYDYLVAGADLIITASYQASFAGLMDRGLSYEQAATLMQRSVELADEARRQFLMDKPVEKKESPDLYANQVQNPSFSSQRTDKLPERNTPSIAGKNSGFHSELRIAPLIAASIGPYGAFLHDGSEYTGEYGLSTAELAAWHRPRMAVLADSNADLLACETIPSLAEAVALLQLLTEFPNIQAWISFSCRDGEHISHGERFVEVVALANQSPQVVAIGINCTAPRHVASLLHHAQSATDTPLLGYPNRGEQWDAEAHCWRAGTGETDFAHAAEQWYRAGARLIGGCCRTTPHDIAQIKEKLITV